MTPCCVRLTISTSRTCGWMSPGRKPRSMIPRPPSSAWTIAIGARVTVSMLADTIGRFSVMCCETRHDRSMAAGSRRVMMLFCGVSRKSSNVQPRTRSVTARAAPAVSRGKSSIAIRFIIDEPMRVPGLLLGLALLFQQLPPVAQPPPPFDEWLDGVRAEAKARGISQATLDAALTGLEPLPIVVQRDRSQAEIVETLDHYLREHVAAKVVKTARTRRAEHAALLDKVQAKYGVPPGITIAVWGLESNFGRFSGVRPTIQTLATLAYDPRRSALFREELFDALKILDSGDVEPAAMRGSWAGALGQPQFMPSSFLLYAQDFDGDGKRDIWHSTADVFASIGNYLAAHGWTRGQPWGREVTIPAAALASLPEHAPLGTEGCLARRQMTVPLPIDTWKEMGARTKAGGAIPETGLDASLVSGVKRHFLVYPNYQAILEYNCVNAYGMSVALLADATDTKASKTTKSAKAPAKKKTKKQ